METTTGGDLAEDGQLTDATVLDLDVTEADKALLGDVVVEHAKGVIEPERGLGTNIVLKGVDGRGGRLCRWQ